MQKCCTPFWEQLKFVYRIHFGGETFFKGVCETGLGILQYGDLKFDEFRSTFVDLYGIDCKKQLLNKLLQENITNAEKSVRL